MATKKESRKERRIEKMVLKRKWDAINKKILPGDSETRLILAKKCALSDDLNVNNVLTVLIRDEDEVIQLTAIKSLAHTGRQREGAQLQWLMANLPPEKEELRQAARDTFGKIKDKK